ncbi:MAG: type IX secretion system membrane protein PorP/SprF [Bacteroidota bacterium]
MKIRLQLFLIGILVFTSLNTVQAQQDEQYTQFMYNKLRYNPAFAGSDGKPVIGVVARNQWIGIEGAPKSQILNFDMPLAGDRAGIGINLTRAQVGMTQNITTDFAYAYRFDWLNGYFSGGLSASMRHISTDFTQARPTQEEDPSIPSGMQSKVVPNFGAGVYYHSKTFYLGLSIPRFLKTNIDLSDDGGTISREVQHYYLMGGVVIGDEGVKLFPQALLKYTPNGPFDADLNLSFIFLERIIAGATYRVGGSRQNSFGESLDALLSIFLTENVLLGLSYDITLSELKRQTDGSVELSLRFTMSGDSSKAPRRIIDPRYF